jgi:hypothetical protein
MQYIALAGSLAANKPKLLASPVNVHRTSRSSGIAMCVPYGPYIPRCVCAYAEGSWRRRLYGTAAYFESDMSSATNPHEPCACTAC